MRNQPWFVAKVMEQTSRGRFIKIYTLFYLKTYFLNGIFKDQHMYMLRYANALVYLVDLFWLPLNCL